MNRFFPMMVLVGLSCLVPAPSSPPMAMAGEGTTPKKTEGSVSSPSEKHRNAAAAPITSSLVGNWIHEGSEGAISLVFESKNRLVYDGDTLHYSLRPNEIVVVQEEGPVVYPYVLKGSSLKIVFPDGKQRVFHRADATRGPAADNPDVLAFFRGSYFQDIRSSGATKLYLYANGSFFEHSDTAYGGKFTDTGGYQTGAWGTGSVNQSQGNWSLRGKRDAGVFILKYRNGKVREVRYQVFKEKGQAFWGEYLINGVHMIKSPIK
jgi:hypothetical protein